MAKPIPLADLPVYSRSNPPVAGTDFSTGAVFLVNKPKDWTSFDAVKYLRGRFKTKKVGHAGTLDPMATGLLIICTGKATKSISQIQEMKKAYIGEITFGGSTPSYDAESDIDTTAETDHITEELILQTLEHDFTGEIMQIPPMYSALKRDGKKLYELARRGKTVELAPRPITIYRHRVLSFNNPVLKIEIECSKGTYIRSIAHDLGKAVNSLGYLSALERTSIGDYSNSEALTLEELNNILRPNG
ncbi:MAG TPA: tRNA pseudouridine(55) synthase TruB [Balneolaceae bacterium]|nr:tRNA pseudouridine(55) synthase TruB [Balneolaceae bacterium]|tara:strand:+ start:126456 stop:127193 length:738 start_codon:yes stop_codon:yes gene_type:complete